MSTDKKDYDNTFADVFDDKLINKRIWTNLNMILAELNLAS
jgi:hypothetical protein